MSLLAEKTANVSTPQEMFSEEIAEILEGLSADQKWIAPKYFYDQRGSELFDQICRLPEYYPTRTEFRIMEENLPDIAERIGPGAAVIEFGAGSNAKARQLLAHLDEPAAYVPVEISGEYLSEQADELARDFPALSVIPVVADFTKPFDLPDHPHTPNRNLIFFPGSTIGNFTRGDARGLLEVMRGEAKPGGALLIGVDLVKDTNTIRSAYNDSDGVTAQFNLNALRHLNAGLDANFRLEHFRHEAIYDSLNERIEMRLVSTRNQTVTIAGESIAFADGEHIVTEYSHKYSVEEFSRLASEAGLTPEAVWTDDEELFSVHYLTVRRPAACDGTAR
jgi:dimethylhistidine N-methyltransferase